MGKLIKNHWARLLILTSAALQVGASIEGFIWPKAFFDFSDMKLDASVNPIPVLPIINISLGLLVIVWEWPLKYVAGSAVHRSIHARAVVYPMCSVAAFLMYQTTNPAIYYLVGTGVYLWALGERETVCAEPWTIPDPNSDRLLDVGLPRPYRVGDTISSEPLNASDQVYETLPKANIPQLPPLIFESWRGATI